VCPAPCSVLPGAHLLLRCSLPHRCIVTPLASLLITPLRPRCSTECTASSRGPSRPDLVVRALAYMPRSMTLAAAFHMFAPRFAPLACQMSIQFSCRIGLTAGGTLISISYPSRSNHRDQGSFLTKRWEELARSCRLVIRPLLPWPLPLLSYGSSPQP
jgi:hypothetical protein